jgi:hypothetical protein
MSSSAKLGEHVFSQVEKIVRACVFAVGRPSLSVCVFFCFLLNAVLLWFCFFMHPQNSELFTLTYGAIVMQMLRDYEDVSEVNRQLDRM